MRYIRSPLWDGLLIWSGVPIGLVLAGLYWTNLTPLLKPCFALFLVLDAAHLLNPLVMIGVHPGLRQRAAARPITWIAVPAVLLLVPTLFWGYISKLPPVTIANWTMSFGGLSLVLRGSWNAWHFGSQNSGLVCVYRHLWRWPGRRWLDRTICIGIAFAVLMPVSLILGGLGLAWFLPQSVRNVLVMQMRMPVALFLFLIGVFNVNHWLTSIALSTKVMPHWWWLIVLALLGASGFLWAYPLTGAKYSGLAALVYLNFGVGFAHYWVDGLIWKRSSPAMQAVLS